MMNPSIEQRESFLYTEKEIPSIDKTVLWDWQVAVDMWHLAGLHRERDEAGDEPGVFILKVLDFHTRNDGLFYSKWRTPYQKWFNFILEMTDFVLKMIDCIQTAATLKRSDVESVVNLCIFLIFIALLTICIIRCDLIAKPAGFHGKMMEMVLEMMDSILKMMGFLLEMMDLYRPAQHLHHHQYRSG